MSHNPQMTSSDRVHWRQILQAAVAAAAAPERAGAISALKKALKGADAVRFPDMRPAPLAVFRAMVMQARGFVAEQDGRLRAAFADDLRRMADRAGDILDGIGIEAEPASWQTRKDING